MKNQEEFIRDLQEENQKLRKALVEIVSLSSSPKNDPMTVHLGYIAKGVLRDVDNGKSQNF